MKKIIAVFLVFAITFQVFGKLVVAGWFTINQQELTELFCVNKQKPETHCDGKCYLNKKLKETDQETQQGSTAPVKHKSATEEVWFCEREVDFIIPASSNILVIAAAPSRYSFRIPTTIFQPPRA